MKKINSVSDALFAVAHRLQTYGWARGNYGDKNGPNCIMGAVWYADVKPGYHSAVIHAINDVFGPMKLGRGRSVVTWNDEPGRTKDDVINALLDAARELKLGGE